MITKADIKEFQTIYRKRFGVELDYTTAHYKLTMLVRQMEIVYQPITKKQATKYDNNNGDYNDGLTSTN